MLKLFAPRRSLPAGRTVAVAIVAVIAMAGVSRLHTHPTNEAAKLIAGAPQGPELDANTPLGGWKSARYSPGVRGQ